MVMSVVVGFLYTSISSLFVFLIMHRSRKFICVLFSCVWLRFKQLWMLFMYLCIESAVVCVWCHIL
jgi:hypothetical protein